MREIFSYGTAGMLASMNDKAMVRYEAGDVLLRRWMVRRSGKLMHCKRIECLLYR